MNLRIHIIATVCAALGLIVAWHSWIIHTNDHPNVILHQHDHTYVCGAAWLDENEHQAMWLEMFHMAKRLRAHEEVIQATADLAKAANDSTQFFATYVDGLLIRLEKNENDITQIKRADTARKARTCGE